MKLNIRAFFGFLLIPAILTPDLASAAEIKTPLQLIESVPKVEINLDGSDYHFGTGFFVDFTGCLLTNAHVARDLEADAPRESLKISLSKNPRRKPELAGEAEIVFIDQEVDIALLCLKNSPDFFPELELAPPGKVDELDFGDNIKVIGYPAIGSDSVTFAQGQIIGFLEEPDLSQIGGADKVNPLKVTLLKMDAVSGPGGSGSPILDKDDKVVGIMFAGQVFGAIPDLAISVKSFFDWRDKIKEKAVPTPGCVLDPVFNLYAKEGVLYYDHKCQTARDHLLEAEVAKPYQAICGQKISQERLYRATAHIRKGSSLEKWNEYLKKVCPAWGLTDPSLRKASVVTLKPVIPPAPVKPAKPVQTPAKNKTVKKTVKTVKRP